MLAGVFVFIFAISKYNPATRYVPCGAQAMQCHEPIPQKRTSPTITVITVITVKVTMR